MRDRMTSPESVLLCVAADGDLPALRAVLADLPADQYGQVYVESSSHAMDAIPAPEGMAAWIIGMVAVIGAAMWVGSRA